MSIFCFNTKGEKTLSTLLSFLTLLHRDKTILFLIFLTFMMMFNMFHCLICEWFFLLTASPFIWLWFLRKIHWTWWKRVCKRPSKIFLSCCCNSSTLWLILVVGCCIFQPALVEIWILNVFNGKQLKKGEKSKKFAAKFNKKIGFLSLHQNAGRVFYSQVKQVFSYKTHFYL